MQLKIPMKQYNVMSGFQKVHISPLFNLSIFFPFHLLILFQEISRFSFKNLQVIYKVRNSSHRQSSSFIICRLKTWIFSPTLSLSRGKVKLIRHKYEPTTSEELFTGGTVDDVFLRMKKPILTQLRANMVIFGNLIVYILIYLLSHGLCTQQQWMHLDAIKI